MLATGHHHDDPDPFEMLHPHLRQHQLEYLVAMPQLSAAILAAGPHSAVCSEHTGVIAPTRLLPELAVSAMTPRVQRPVRHHRGCMMTSSA